MSEVEPGETATILRKEKQRKKVSDFHYPWYNIHLSHILITGVPKKRDTEEYLKKLGFFFFSKFDETLGPYLKISIGKKSPHWPDVEQ